MDAYAILKAQAAQKLDAAISAARKEYRETCDKINSLRRELGDEPEPGVRVEKTAIDTVRELMPRNRTFTNAEMLQLVQDSVPDRHWNRGTVKAAIYKLADRREIRRIVKDAKGHIVWAAMEYECESKPYDAMAMSDVIAEVLEGSDPMRPAELVVAIQALGCRTDDNPETVLRCVRKALQNNPRRFTRSGDGWVTASSQDSQD